MDNQVCRLQPVLLQIGAVANPVHHGEQAGCLERGEHAVPSASVIVHALRSVRQEGFGRTGTSPNVGSDNDEKRVLRHGQEGLAALRMTLEQVQLVGKGAGLRVEKAEARPSAGEIQPRDVVVPTALALVYDQVGLARHFQDITEGGEGRGRQRLSDDLHRRDGTAPGIIGGITRYHAARPMPEGCG